jgi:uncharacterized protein (DUF302 family)
MRKIVLLCLLCLYLPYLHAAEGVISQPSDQPVATTMDRLEKIVASKGFRVFARVDHGAGAAGVDMALRPTQLLIFGNPKGGSVLMQSAQSVGIDLPLKYLVWEDADGQVWVSWNAPAYLAGRHGLDPQMPVLTKMSNGLAGMAKAATTP